MAESSTEEKLKSALWYSIGKITTQESTHLNTTSTPQFIGTLTEMVWSQIENIANDLQTFSHHGGRTTVNADDVILICRRNQVLEDIMREFVDARRAGKEKGGKRKGGKGKSGGGVEKKKGGGVRRK